MCRSMADIRSTAAEIRRGKEKERKKEEEGKKLQGKNIMAPLLHRAAARNRMKIYMVSLLHRATINYHLVALELPFIPKVIDCMHHTIF